MLNKLWCAVLVFLVACTSATAAEQVNNCRLKGGSLVLLSAEACVMEGGAVIAAATPVVRDADLHLADDPKLAAAQRAVAALLGKPVQEKDARSKAPESVERAVKFEGCRLLAEESLHVDRGNLFSSRKSFKINSTVDMRNIQRDAFDVLGKVSSLGGGLKAYAVYFEENKRTAGNNLAISLLEQREEGFRKYTLPMSAAYWDAPRDDLWMLDEYGYPKDNGMGNAATDKVRIMFLVNTSDDAVALKQALDELHTLCKP
jgi:hypothetical protein